MKLKHVFLALLVAVVALWSCDKISQPIITQQSGTLPNTMPDFTNSSTSTGPAAYTNYKMLLEVCGGHLCTNCPLGETDAENVLNSNIGAQVVFMQDEMGPEADTVTYAGYPDTAFRKVYQCVADSNWYKTFNTNPDPWGMVNREGAPSKTLVIYGNYQDSCTTIISRNTSPAVTINIHTSCWVTTSPRIIGAEFQLDFKKSLSGTYALQTMIIEDSIVDWQVDNAKFLSNYLHRNIVRGAFGDNKGGNTWGVSIPPDSSSVAGATWTSSQVYDFTNGENGKAKGWKMAHCYIVAFVSNVATYEVVQAEMIKME